MHIFCIYFNIQYATSILLYTNYLLSHRDLAFILSLDGLVDWVALSFVQKPSDMVEFRQLAGNSVKLMAKLEKPSAIEALDEVCTMPIVCGLYSQYLYDH